MFLFVQSGKKTPTNTRWLMQEHVLLSAGAQSLPNYSRASFWKFRPKFGHNFAALKMEKRSTATTIHGHTLSTDLIRGEKSRIRHVLFGNKISLFLASITKHLIALFKANINSCCKLIFMDISGHCCVELLANLLQWKLFNERLSVSKPLQSIVEMKKKLLIIIPSRNSYSFAFDLLTCCRP